MSQCPRVSYFVTHRVAEKPDAHDRTLTRGFDSSIVEHSAHRPWPMPATPWLMTQSWNNLLFAHWRADVSQIRRAVPDAFDLDLFDGEAWLGIVPFYMTNVGIRSLPAVPWLSAFPELNVRTYVRVDERRVSRRRGELSECASKPRAC